MGQDRNDLREKVPGKTGAVATKAKAKAGAKGLSPQRVTAAKDEARAKGQKAAAKGGQAAAKGGQAVAKGGQAVAKSGGKAVAGTLGGARLVMALALRNKVKAAVAAATAVVAAVAGGRIVRRRKSS